MGWLLPILSWGGGTRGGPRKGQLRISRKTKLLLALGALCMAILFFYLSIQVAINCSVETGKACI